MATYQVLCWKDIPTQIKVKDDAGEVKMQLDPRMMEIIDEKAMATGGGGSDEYLDAWNWTDAAERDGTAEEVAKTLKEELEAKFLNP